MTFFSTWTYFHKILFSITLLINCYNLDRTVSLIFISEIGCPEERLEAYGELVSLLPKSNRDTLKYLLWFLNIVAENSQDRHDSDGLPVRLL